MPFPGSAPSLPVTSSWDSEIVATISICSLPALVCGDMTFFAAEAGVAISTTIPRAANVRIRTAVLNLTPAAPEK